jgi:hypothetical protein
VRESHCHALKDKFETQNQLAMSTLSMMDSLSWSLSRVYNTDDLCLNRKHQNGRGGRMLDFHQAVGPFVVSQILAAIRRSDNMTHFAKSSY